MLANRSDMQGTHQFRRPMPRLWAVVLIAAGCTAINGCEKKEGTKETPAKPAQSIVETKISPENITAQTASTSFLLMPSGALTASRRVQGTAITLETHSNDAAQLLTIGKKEYPGLILDFSRAETRATTGKLGTLGKQIVVNGKVAGTSLAETLTLEVYDDFPNLALLSVTIRNEGNSDVPLDSVTLQRHGFAAPAKDKDRGPLWTFQGSSLNWGKDETFLMPAKFFQENPFGAPVPVKGDLGAVGGGIPVVAFWTRDVGEAIGHVETVPFTLSIPVRTTTNGGVEAGVKIAANTILRPGDVFSSPRTFLTIYSGDFYKPLSLWSSVVDKEGLKKTTDNDEDYKVSWCGWGYEFGVTPKQMLNTIPKLKELNIHWATLDDGWFNNYGDWQGHYPAFAGVAMQDMVREFHNQGIKMQLWWLPLGVEDGHYGYGGRKYEVSDILKEHPDWLILDKQGKPARMARNLATLCPAVPGVQAYYKQLTERFIRDWGFDGHKLDNIWSTPLCYNPKHHHNSPYDSVYAMADVYKIIFETTRALKPESVTQSCPCGTPPNLAWLRYMDQAVTADPVGSIQVRRRVKMYKALLGPRAAVYGDHVELTRITGASSDNEQDTGDDFASTLGTGGVLGTKFTWPDYGPKFKNAYLTDAKNAHWKEWISLYNDKLLSKGNFLDLYVYGFDVPEAYAIEKNGDYYYAFYAPGKDKSAKTNPANHASWKGAIELRGLPAKTFRITDYVHHKDLGTVTGPTGKLDVSFNDNLLIEADPVP
jgi:alpha-galactosidase